MLDCKGIAAAFIAEISPGKPNESQNEEDLWFAGHIGCSAERRRRLPPTMSLSLEWLGLIVMLQLVSFEGSNADVHWLGM